MAGPDRAPGPVLAESALALSERRPPCRPPFSSRTPAFGTVYVLQALDGTGLVKIGASGNPNLRIRKITAGLRAPVRVVAVILTADQWGLEEWLHERFAGQRVHGEWFRLSEEDLALLVRPRSAPPGGAP